MAEWDASSWPQRYVNSNHDVNRALRGHSLPDRKLGEHWTHADVRNFVKWMRAHCEVTDAPRILYRGANMATLFNEARFTKTPTFLSTSTDAAVASEFGKWYKTKGVLHVLHLAPGCRVFDMAPCYATMKVPAVSREKEVIVLPGHRATFRCRRGWRRHWDLSFET